MQGMDSDDLVTSLMQFIVGKRVVSVFHNEDTDEGFHTDLLTMDACSRRWLVKRRRVGIVDVALCGGY